MDNFQLYRTNVLLGGQMKWDLVLGSTASDLVVTDFHLSPISNNVPYTYQIDENLLYNRHQDNVKAYYKKVRSNFYSDMLDPKFKHNWPIISNEKPVNYFNTYDMGCRISKEDYGKTFEFLCPIWLEKLNTTKKSKIENNIKIETKESIESICFDISLYPALDDANISKNLLASKMLELRNIENGLEFHNNFVTYFENYVNDCGFNTGSDDVINLKFRDNHAKVTGLNIETGNIETRNLPGILSNLTSRERPLMEADNMIITSFKNNNLICKQLFNFNLCFNISDITSSVIEKLLKGQDIDIKIDVYIKKSIETKTANNDISYSVEYNKLEKRDFSTNYENIKKEVIGNTEIDYNVLDYNVLDYLKDNNALELINKNKYCQKICHWALADNNDYIFNLYEGFSGLNKVDDETYENTHSYGNTPDTNITHINYSKNTTGWLNKHYVENYNEFYNLYSAVKNTRPMCTKIGSSKYVNNIKYNFNDAEKYIIGIVSDSSYQPVPNTGDNIIKEIKNRLLNNDHNDIISFEITENNDTKVIILKNDDLLMIVVADENYLAFAKLKDLINKTENIGSDSGLEYIKNFMNSVISPEIIHINSGLRYYFAESPSKETREINYSKDNKFTDYVIRYDGKIKPQFVTSGNAIYYKDIITPDEANSGDTIYSKHPEYEPLYPSIGYCAIKSIDINHSSNIIITFDELGNVKTDYNNYILYDKMPNESILNNLKLNIDTFWFNNSRIKIK